MPVDHWHCHCHRPAPAALRSRLGPGVGYDRAEPPAELPGVLRVYLNPCGPARAAAGRSTRSPASDRVRPACARGDRGRRGLAAAVRPERSAQGPTAERAPCLVAGIVGYPARFGSVLIFGFARIQYTPTRRDAPSRHSTHNRVTPETRHDARPRSDYNDLRTTEHSSARSDLDLPRARITWNEHHDA